MNLLQIHRMRVEAIQCERGSLSDRHATDISTSKLTAWNLGFHDIAGLKPQESLAPRSMAYRKAVSVGRTHLTRPMPGRFDQERLNIPDLNCLVSAIADTRRVNPMGFRQASQGSVELRQSA